MFSFSPLLLASRTDCHRRQMRGRAGRKGKDEVGETYLICQKADLEAVAELLEAETPAIASGLAPEKRGVKRYVVNQPFLDRVVDIVQGTFGSHSNPAGLRSRCDQGIR